MNIFLLAPTTLLGVLWAFPAALGNALFGSPDTALRVGGALAMAVLLYLGVNTARAKLAAAQQAPMGAGGAQQVVVAETPMEGLEALRRSMAAYDQSVVRAARSASSPCCEVSRLRFAGCATRRLCRCPAPRVARPRLRKRRLKTSVRLTISPSPSAARPATAAVPDGRRGPRRTPGARLRL